MALAGDLRVLIGRLRRRLREEANPGDLSMSQVSVLTRLEPRRPGDRDGAGARRGNAAAVNGRHCRRHARGGPRRRRARSGRWPADRPSITDSCREVLRAMRAARVDWLTRILETRLTPDERDQLAAGIRLL